MIPPEAPVPAPGICVQPAKQDLESVLIALDDQARDAEQGDRNGQVEDRVRGDHRQTADAAAHGEGFDGDAEDHRRAREGEEQHVLVHLHLFHVVPSLPVSR